MANIIETNEGIVSDGEYEDKELEQWLSANNIECAAHKLLQKKVKMHELSEIDPKAAKQYAKQSLGLDEIEANRFSKAIQSLSPIADKNNNPLSKSQIIVLSQEANDAMNELYNKKDEINADIKNIKQHIQHLNDANHTNEEEIEKFKQQVIHQLDQRLKHLRRKSNKDITKQLNLCSNHLELLQKHNQALNKIELKMNDILADDAIHKRKRESHIIALCDDTQHTELIALHLCPRIKITINKNIIMEHVNRIGTINYNPHAANIQIKSRNIKTENDCDSDEKIVEIDLESENYFVSKMSEKMVHDEDSQRMEVKTDWKQTYDEAFGFIWRKVEDTNECWNILGKDVECIDDKKTICKLSDGYSSYFGNVCVPSTSYKICMWYIRVNKVTKRFAVGISSDGGNEKIFYNDKKSSNYAYDSSGYKISRGRFEKYGKSFSDGDVIGIKLDEIQKCLQFTLNGNPQSIAYRNIDTHSDIHYKLAIHLYYKHDSATIMNYDRL